MLLKVQLLLCLAGALAMPEPRPEEDLMDLYVQHMDETMGTRAYYERLRAEKEARSESQTRHKRSVMESPLFQVARPVKQSLEGNDRPKAKKRFPYERDGLDFPNGREENYDQDTDVVDEKTAKPEYTSERIFKSMYPEEIEQFLSKKKSKKPTFLKKSKEIVKDAGGRDPWSTVHITMDDNFRAETLESLRDSFRLPKDGEWTVIKKSELFPNETDESKAAIPAEERDTEDISAAVDAVMDKYHEESVDARPKLLNKFAKFAREKRAVHGQHKNMHFSRSEKLDEDGDVVLEWDPTDDENVTFRVTAKTLGYVGLGFNDKGHMMGADIVLAWVDDHTHVPTLLDSHGVETANAAPETDASQDVHLIHGSQNGTHTVVTFTRRWQTCDPQDRSLTGDTIRVLWALHQTDPELNAARFHGDRRGSRALRLRAAAPHPPPNADDPDMIKWDVKLNQFTVTNTTDTVYWCKIFKAPKLSQKHHMIGYTPLVEKANEALVHHVILYECASRQPILAEHSRLAGAHCYSPTMPKEWDSCLQPVLAWARGSRGEWLPEHVGLPVAEHQEEGSYYMLEVHYNNKDGRQVMDSSGVRLHLTPNTRKMEAGIMVAGVAVSPLHMVPPQQKEYATAGYCTPQCTSKMFDEDGINVVSVVLHSHLAGRRLSLKHIRQGKELPPIVQDNHFDFDYQQSHTLEREVKILPGDELVAECVYDTRGRTKPTFGGYAATQEMCLAFVLHYPRSPLAACYSMTPVKEFFNALNVQSFKGVSMEQVEKLFLSTTTETVTLPVSPNHHSPMYPDLRSNDNADVDLIRQTKSALISKGDYIDYDDIFARLVIEKPDEFKDHTLSDHITALAWNDTALSKSIERSLYQGKHVTFCRTREDVLPRSPAIQMFPNYTALPESNDTRCREFHAAYGSNASASLYASLLLPLLLLLTATLLP